jgi:hypothetical protein
VKRYVDMGDHWFDTTFTHNKPVFGSHGEIVGYYYVPRIPKSVVPEIDPAKVYSKEEWEENELWRKYQF